MAGFRADGSASLFFADDPVYQFNTTGELRRAFVAGLSYKANGSQLAHGGCQFRNSRGGRLQLEPGPFDAAAQSRLLAEMQTHLAALSAALARSEVKIAEQVPATAGVGTAPGRLASGDIGDRADIAASPHAR